MDPIVLFYLLKRKKKQKRRFWVHPLVQNRFKLGEHLKVESMFRAFPDKFQEYTRLTCEQFEYLESVISPIISKKTTNFREPLSPRIRLFITLRYLATGDSYQSIATSYCVGKTSVHTIIGETCVAIWESLVQKFVKAPHSKSEWLKVAKGFEEDWQLPNCIGALDGKHIQLVAPPNSGSQYFNYKRTFSIVLMASCDAHYKFTTVDVGAFGRQSDGGILANSPFGKKLYEGRLNIQGRYQLPGSTRRTPLYFVGDEAFPLKPFLLRPYPGTELDTRKRIFNYRLSRGRGVIENCFGILSSRFRVLRKPIQASTERATSIVKATISLHNFILNQENIQCSDAPLPVLHDVCSNMNENLSGTAVRDIMSCYFMQEGEVPWQTNSVFNIKS